jgi:Holliday junction resolvasome RuvABC ATP-dependent DNA helicase subunit
MTTFLYNPDRKTRDQLIAEFVVRTNLLEEIMHDLETSEMKYAEQHYLLVGPRGSGKTTLLNRIKYAVEDSENLQSWLIPVLFSEEQYNISELVDVWENIARVLEDHYDFKDLTAQITQHAQLYHFEQRAYSVLEAALRERNKKLLLLVDNIGDFLAKFTKIEVRRLREILQTKSDIRLIGGSPTYLGILLDYHHPLFEFFKVIRLDDLSVPESQKLIAKLGQVYEQEQTINSLLKEQSGRILTLLLLTGGLPRIVTLIYKVIADHPEENCLRDLERILDIVTPFYKHRMDNLPAHQQKVVDAIAKSWDPVAIKKIAGRVRLDNRTIAMQLRYLERKEMVEKRKTGKQGHVYQLKERLFNIWYLVRYGRKLEREKMADFINFSEDWWNSFEVEGTVKAYIEKGRPNRLPRPDFLLHKLSDIITSLHHLDVYMEMMRDVFINGIVLYAKDEKRLAKFKDSAFLNFVIQAFRLLFLDDPKLLRKSGVLTWPEFVPGYEPMHQALMIIDGEWDYSRIPPEKEQLIRNIVERITSND